MYEKKAHKKIELFGGSILVKILKGSVILIIFLLHSQSYSQTTIWLEDFPYTDGTIIGSGTPEKWTRDVSACTFSNKNDYFEVKSNQMEGRDLDGEAVWTSETIDISSYTNVGLTVDVSCSTPNLEVSDYIRFYYKIDGGTETLFDVNGDNSNDFDPLVASQSGLNGNNLVIVVRVYNDGGQEIHRFDNMLVFEPVPGDDCSLAIPINEVSNLYFSTSLASSSGINPGCGGTTNPVDLWYAYTATSSGTGSFDLCGSVFNTRLAIYDACGGNLLACNDDNGPQCTGTNASVDISVLTGVTYYVQVSGNEASTGSGDITIAVNPSTNNDLCTSATPINDVTDLAFTTVGATAGGDNPGCGGTDPVDIWYAYTPSYNGVAIFDLCGSSFDTRLAVWDACGGSVLACNDNDDFCGTGSVQSYLTLSVVTSTTYYVQVGGSNSLTGSGNLTIAVSPIILGDDCSNADPINEVTDLAFNTSTNTASGVIPSCGGSTAPIDIWYAYTATMSGTATFDLCGSSYDTRLSIWDACNGTELACNDDDDYCGSGSLQSYVTATVTVGTTYYVQVGGYNANAGSGDLTIAVVGNNDFCSSATPIGEVTDLAFTTAAATAGGDNPGCGGTTDPLDIWYAYTSTVTGTGAFDLCGSTYDTRLAIWDACSGTVLACNDDDDLCGSGSLQSYISMAVISGNTYYIQVGGYNANVGTGDLSISVVATSEGIWTGAISTDWNTNGNWLDGNIPDGTIDVYIAAGLPNYPEVDETANCSLLNVAGAASITISTGSNISIGGDFVCSGILIVNDGICAISGDFNNSATAYVDINGGNLTMDGWYETGSFTWARGAVELSGGAINVATNVAMSNASGNSIMNGPFNLNIGGTVHMQASSFSEISGGTITLTGTGYVLPSSGTETFAVYNLVINATGTYVFARDATFNSDSIINNLEVQSGTVQFLSSTGTGMPENFYVGNNLSISNGATIDVNTNTSITLYGNIVNNGTFNHNAGLFVFDGSTTISGVSSTSFIDATINTGRDLIAPASATLNFSGDLTVNGAFKHNNGTIQFNGSTQTLSGTAQTLFNNLTVASGSTTTIGSSGQNIRGVLKSDGTLVTGDNITLLSSDVQTALVDGSGTGVISGNIIMQRYLPSSFGYRYVSSPCISATADEFSPYVDFGASFPPLFSYDEDKTSAGWVNYSTTTNSLTPLVGYTLNFGYTSSPLTFEITGAVNNGTQTPLMLYNHNHLYTAGFNLVGNPYPSPIDWDATSGWTLTNIDDAVYYFNPSTTDQYGGTYSSYINGISSDGVAVGIIPSMQGFFIHVSDGTYPVSATFGTDNNIRVNNLSPVYHKNTIVNTNALLRICAEYSDNSFTCDPLAICFNDSLTTGFKKEYDALKILNSDVGVPSFYAISPDNANLSIYSLPYSEDSINIIPLGLKTEIDSWVSFFPMKIEQFPDDMQIYLRDNVAGVYHNLRPGDEYKAFLSSGIHNERFSVVTSQKDLRHIPSENEYYYSYSSGGSVFVFLKTPMESEVDVSLIDLTGNEVWGGILYGNGYHEFNVNVVTGLYIINLQSEYGSYTKKLMLLN